MVFGSWRIFGEWKKRKWSLLYIIKKNDIVYLISWRIEKSLFLEEKNNMSGWIKVVINCGLLI